MKAPGNPTAEEVAEAIDTLRAFAQGIEHPRILLEVAIDTLDNADVFVGIDGEGV